MYNQHVWLVTLFRNDCLSSLRWHLFRQIRLIFNSVRIKKRKPIVNFRNNCIHVLFGFDSFHSFWFLLASANVTHSNPFPKKQLKCICDRKYVCRFEYPQKQKPRSIPYHYSTKKNVYPSGNDEISMNSLSTTSSSKAESFSWMSVSSTRTTALTFFSTISFSNFFAITLFHCIFESNIQQLKQCHFMFSSLNCIITLNILWMSSNITTHIQ